MKYPLALLMLSGLLPVWSSAAGQELVLEKKPQEAKVEGKKAAAPIMKMDGQEGLLIHYKDFRSGYFGENHPYSDVLGFTFWKTPGTVLKEVVETPDFSSEKKHDTEILSKIPNREHMSAESLEKKYNELLEKRKLLSYDRVNGLKLYGPEEYQKHALVARLGIYRQVQGSGRLEEGGNAVLIAVRESFALYNYTQPGLAS